MPFVEVSTTPLEKVASVGYALYKYFAPQKRHPVILNEFTTDDKKNKTIKKSKEKRRKSISNNLSRSDSKDSKSGSAGSDTQATMTNQAVTGSGSLDLGSDAAQSTPETTEEQLEEYATDLEIAKNLNKKILGEQGKFLSYDGAKVDYAALAENKCHLPCRNTPNVTDHELC
ncbi:hypothetical protein SARC_02626 [Sphaeroforma arctica JP610]|uniref:Uncharacterized protein n=1 Tax=Sphaeroforma arctica JP610 TaxID=667725 RepID=A0A0L0G8D6_9EUKA|nr:hypothetical protein SARC_02626 [Sphaeroforma arctica JP610]KNC85169.1 hypothetical protein SARC_02626 [Sphaeroforma arctica JP610]|eukprot:XP_014159071.1 hypothetical protein SARC_02626 [Sphaeroforma arctica JP610]